MFSNMNECTFILCVENSSIRLDEDAHEKCAGAASIRVEVLMVAAGLQPQALVGPQVKHDVRRCPVPVIPVCTHLRFGRTLQLQL